MKSFVVITILALLNSYVTLRITNVLLPTKYHAQSMILVIIGLVAFQSIGLFGESCSLLKIEQRLNLSGLLSSIYQASYLVFGIVSCLFCYILIMDIVRIALCILLSVPSSNYIYFDKFSFSVIIFVTLVTTIIGIIEIKKGSKVQRVEIFLKNLPTSFDGFTIAQISDLHVGLTIRKDEVVKVVDVANSLLPNLIALTGDFVDGSVKSLKDDTAPLNKLKSTHGTFFVTGNHEYYSGAEEWIEEFTNLGIKNLSNEHVLIKNNSDQIILAGVTDYSTKGHLSEDASSPRKALMGAPVGLTKILLAHQPSSYTEAHKAGFDLQLSGHTHGGQYFPFTLLIRFFHRYYKGLNLHEGMWLYINRGTGYWGPPLRSGAPPEITLITLKSPSLTSGIEQDN